MFVARSLPRVLGVLRPVRGSLPGLKEPGGKREGKKGFGRGPSLGLGCGKQGWAVEGGPGLWHGRRKALVSGRVGDQLGVKAEAEGDAVLYGCLVHFSFITSNF